MRGVFTIGLFGICCSAAVAYDGDTHYGLTYVIARSVGYTPEQARRIASADVQIDAESNTTTEPVQDLSFFSDAFPPRIRFHAFRDVQYSTGEQADAAIQVQLSTLRNDVSRLNNAGVFLHAYQDSYSHAQYWCRFGHYSPFGDLPIGATTDYESYNPTSWPNRNMEMAQGTAAQLVSLFPANNGFQPRAVDNNVLTTAVNALVTANPDAGFFGPNVNAGLSALQTSLLANREGSIPQNYPYALSDTGGVASPSAAWQNSFGITSTLTVNIKMAPNKAGIGLGPGTLNVLYWDPWTGKKVFLPFNKTPYAIPSSGGSVGIPGFPVGATRIVYSAPYAAKTLVTDVMKPSEQRTFSFDWDYFTVHARDTTKPVTFGSISMVGLRANSHVDKSFPNGFFTNAFAVPFRQGALRVYYGGTNGLSSGCRFSSLGWNGFAATGSRVLLHYVRGGRIVSAAEGQGTFNLSLNPDGSATATYSVSGYSSNGDLLASSGTASCAPGSLEAVPSHVL